VAGEGSTSADRQRCVDVQLERNQLRLQYDNLSQPRRLSASAWPTTVVAGDTVRFAGYSNYLLFTSKAELRVFTANDVMQRRLLATVPLDAGLRGEWQVPDGLRSAWRSRYRRQAVLPRARVRPPGPLRRNRRPVAVAGRAPQARP
jgi:hypothetical protein